MIKTKEDLKYYLVEDLKRFGNKRPSFKDWLLHNEDWFIYIYLKHLRFFEFYKNSKKSKILLYYHWFILKRLGFKLRITIYPNTIGPGFRIYHLGDFIHIKQNCKIGKNCTILPGVVFGNKFVEEDNSSVNVGDNCYIGLGVRIFGSVNIGNNVIIGANSVVTKDIPDNVVVCGCPAKIVRKINN